MGFWWRWETKYNQLFAENEKLKSEIKSLELKISKVLKLYEKQSDKIKVLNNEISNLEKKSTHWKDQTYQYYEKLKNSNVKLSDKINDYNELVDDYNVMDKLLYDETTKPKLVIDKTKVKWHFKDTKGNNYGINWSVKSYEDWKVYSDEKSLTQDLVYLNTDDGDTRKIISLDGFVTGKFFDCCIDKLYDNSDSNSDFIYEVWYIVSQMTVYDKDVSPKSQGRFAIETITRGGGGL